MTFVAPLHPHTREFLSDLYACRAAHLHLSGVPLKEAKAEARTLALSFRDALLPGPDGEPPALIEMEPNVILRELGAGIVPEEFVDGPVFHPSMEVGHDRKTSTAT